MTKSAVITKCWTPQSSHRDTFFSIYLVSLQVRYLNLNTFDGLADGLDWILAATNNS